MTPCSDVYSRFIYPSEFYKMSENTIGFLHPGAMGVSLAACAQANNYKAHWVSADRSEATKHRAKQHGLIDSESIESLCASCSIILSVCPPHAANTVADQVIAARFTGTFVDANAISPDRSHRIGNRLRNAGIESVDGGIIGGPAWQDGTILYLSGERAESIAACFENGFLETRVLSDRVGDASALKMCYAAYSKGSMALLSAIVAASEKLGVRDALETQWELDEPGFAPQTHERMARVTKKAWRYVGEMDEIAATFESVGLPGGFHHGASDVYQRLADLKDHDATFEQVLEHLNRTLPTEP